MMNAGECKDRVEYRVERRQDLRWTWISWRDDGSGRCRCCSNYRRSHETRLTTSKLGKRNWGQLWLLIQPRRLVRVTTQDSFTSHSGTAPSVQATAGVRASLGSDIGGDGDPDVITIDNYSASFYVYKNDGNGDDGDGPIFDNGTAVSIGSQADSVDIALGDLDGDGDTDVVTRNDKGANFKIFTNNGSGSFTAGARLIPRPLQTTLSELRRLI